MTDKIIDEGWFGGGAKKKTEAPARDNYDDMASMHRVLEKHGYTSKEHKTLGRVYLHKGGEHRTHLRSGSIENGKINTKRATAIHSTGDRFYDHKSLDNHLTKMHRLREEAEPIDELSQGALKGYLDKAHQDPGRRQGVHMAAYKRMKTIFNDSPATTKRGKEQQDRMLKKQHGRATSAPMQKPQVREEITTMDVQKILEAAKVNAKKKKGFDEKDEGHLPDPTKKLKTPDGSKNAVKEEHLDELSRKTLKSYAKKAATSRDRLNNKGSNEEDKSMSTDGYKYPEKQERHQKNATKLYGKAMNREAGIEQAKKRLAKEEQEVDLDTYSLNEEHLMEITLVGMPLPDRIARHQMMTTHHAELARKASDWAQQGDSEKWHKIAAVHSKTAAVHAKMLKDCSVQHRKDMGKKMAAEEVEQIDEISKKVVKSYLKKATHSQKDAERKIDHADKHPNARRKFDYDETNQTLGKRDFGIDLAKKRLKEAQEHLDELTGKGKIGGIATHHVQQARKAGAEYEDAEKEHGEESDQAYMKGMKASYHDNQADRARTLIKLRDTAKAHKSLKAQAKNNRDNKMFDPEK